MNYNQIRGVELPVSGMLMLHRCLVDEPLVSEISISRRFSCLGAVEPIPSTLRKPFDFAKGSSPSAEASVFENVATWLGRPTSCKNGNGFNWLGERTQWDYRETGGGFHSSGTPCGRAGRLRCCSPAPWQPT